MKEKNVETLNKGGMNDKIDGPGSLSAFTLLSSLVSYSSESARQSLCPRGDVEESPGSIGQGAR